MEERPVVEEEELIEMAKAVQFVVEARLIELAKAIQYLPNFSASVVLGGIELRYIWEHEGRHLSTSSITLWKGIRVANKNPLLAAMTHLEEQADKWGEDDGEDSEDHIAT